MCKGWLLVYAGRKVCTTCVGICCCDLVNKSSMLADFVNHWTAGLKDGASNLDVFTAVRKHKDTF